MGHHASKLFKGVNYATLPVWMCNTEFDIAYFSPLVTLKISLSNATVIIFVRPNEGKVAKSISFRPFQVPVQLVVYPPIAKQY